MLRSIATVSILTALTATVVSTADAAIQLAPHARVIEPSDVLAEYVEERDGRLWLDLPGVASWELNGVSGEDESGVHPMDAEVVAEAWREIASIFTDVVPVTIVVLPYPRTQLPVSSAEDNLIYLSPGSAPYTDRQVHFLVAHEMGHVVHREFVDDEESWALYRELRDIEDTDVYHDWAGHANRPREIFAEDFRFLFGGEDANYSGSIENHGLALPNEVAGLTAYFHSLVGRAAPALSVGSAPVPAVRISPNPTRGPVVIALSWPVDATAELSTLRIFDVTGRVVLSRSLLASPGGERRIHWDGRTDDGRQVAAGVYYATVGDDRRVAEMPTSRLVVVR